MLIGRISGKLDQWNNPTLPNSIAKVDLMRIGFVALAALAVWLRVWEPFQKISIIGIVPTATGGRSIWKEAFENLREMRMTMERTMAFALGWFYL